MWQEKLEAELDMMHKKLELKKNAHSTSTQPNLKITSFQGTPTDWVWFSNMLVMQVHTKFGYLLEMVSLKAKENIPNLKPGEMGYKIASEYG